MMNMVKYMLVSAAQLGPAGPKGVARLTAERIIKTS